MVLISFLVSQNVGKILVHFTYRTTLKWMFLTLLRVSGGGLKFRITAKKKTVLILQRSVMTACVLARYHNSISRHLRVKHKKQKIISSNRKHSLYKRKLIFLHSFLILYKTSESRKSSLLNNDV